MVCVTEQTGRLLADQLTAVLGEGVTIEIIATQDVPLPSRLEADLILLTSRPLAPAVNSRVAPGTPILVTNRTLWRRDWQAIMALPARTRVLMVHETLETAHNAIALLYELGVKHLELIPYAPGAETVPDVDLAITFGHPHLVPPGVHRVKDTGPRPLDPQTILDVMTRLDLLTEESSLRLQGWMGKTMARSHGLTATIAWVGELRQQLETVLDFSGDAIVACDSAGRVTVFNRRAEELLGLRGAEIVGQPAAEVLPALALEAVLAGRPPLPNQPVQAMGQSLLVTYVPLRRHGRLVGAAALCRPAQGAVSDYTLALQPRERGHAARYTFADMVGHSEVLQRVISLARQMARSDSTILIGGETGTGKEVLAQAIHNASPRQRGPFVAVNCAALPESLLESELFGYEEGSFTGAARGGRRGLFEQAHTGTIFLDEIGDISPSVQARLLRVLEERHLMRVGGSRVIPVDVRVIAATNRDLKALCDEGRFRADLYYRLSVLPIHLPPLRERLEDIPVLAQRFLAQRGCHRPLSPEIIAALTKHTWPGNVRELRNCMEYMVTVAAGEELTPAHLPPEMQETAAASPSPAAAASPARALTASPLPGDETRMILTAIAKAEAAGRRVGRGTLAAQLRAAGLMLTEAEVRARLSRMAAAGLVSPGRGRAGTRLTPAGYQYLREQAH